MQTSHICGSPYLPTSDDWVLQLMHFSLKHIKEGNDNAMAAMISESAGGLAMSPSSLLTLSMTDWACSVMVIGNWKIGRHQHPHVT